MLNPNESYRDQPHVSRMSCLAESYMLIHRNLSQPPEKHNKHVIQQARSSIGRYIDMIT